MIINRIVILIVMVMIIVMIIVIIIIIIIVIVILITAIIGARREPLVRPARADRRGDLVRVCIYINI